MLFTCVDDERFIAFADEYGGHLARLAIRVRLSPVVHEMEYPLLLVGTGFVAPHDQMTISRV